MGSIKRGSSQQYNNPTNIINKGLLPLQSKTAMAVIATALLSGCAALGGGSTAKDGYSCEGKASYTAEFTSVWAQASHPIDFPENPHYSALIGSTHGKDKPLWAVGQKASPGIQDVAEKGLNRKLMAEVNWAIKIDEAGALIKGDDLKAAAGTVSVDFEVDDEFSHVSLLTMIAPSPDWFVGVSSLNLCGQGQWRTELALELDSYDGGTDSGSTYMAADVVTSPQDVIRVLPANTLPNGQKEPALGALTLRLNTVN